MSCAFNNTNLLNRVLSKNIEKLPSKFLKNEQSSVIIETEKAYLRIDYESSNKPKIHVYFIDKATCETYKKKYYINSKTKKRSGAEQERMEQLRECLFVDASQLSFTYSYPEMDLSNDSIFSDDNNASDEYVNSEVDILLLRKDTFIDINGANLIDLNHEISEVQRQMDIRKELYINDNSEKDTWKYNILSTLLFKANEVWSDL